ncbi:MAG TPA: site-specific DNA-methyltransferase [Chitinophagaceae bacterium]|nr:site-specific DNA-methyltransferase [Chitinophagaceae bacterium]
MIEINKNYNESNLETMARMPDNFIDLTVTSPPYDNLRTYNGYSFDFENVAKELYRVTKKGGVVVWVVNDKTKNYCESLTSFKQAILFVETAGFNLHDTMIYKRQAAFPDVVRYYQEFEYMFVFSKGKPKTINLLRQNKSESTIKRNNSGIHKSRHERQQNGEIKNGDLKSIQRVNNAKLDDTRIRSNIWEIATGSQKSTKDKIAFEHPAIFPEQLANDHILSWSNEGDLIYDPFMGSGTTAKMAIKNNRNWIGSEISDEYCSIIEQRVRTAEPLLFSYCQ